MDVNDLKSLAGKKNIPQGIIYKDYVITVILEQISKGPYLDDLIFKGGTCLKKIYFEETRFSVDIDFTCLEYGAIDEMITDLKSGLEDNKVRNVNFDRIREQGRWEEGISYKLKYKDLNEHPNSVKIDLSLRELPILEPQVREVLNPDYDKIPNFELYVFPLKEILAEKARAIVTRKAARDVFDLWFLLKRGVELDLGLVEKKMDIYDDDEFDVDEFFDKIDEKEGDWERDLMMLVPEAPDFETVREEIRSIL